MVNISVETISPALSRTFTAGRQSCWRGGVHKDNFPSSPPLRSITQRWSLHRAGRLATWHPWSPPSPGNETCDRNQPATSLPPPLPSLLCSLSRFCCFCSLRFSIHPPSSSFSLHLLANALTLGRTCEFTRGKKEQAQVEIGRFTRKEK